MADRGTDVDSATVSDQAATPRLARLVDPRALKWHAAALLVLLLALIPALDNGVVGLPDEGAYAAQAANLGDGSWVGPLVAPEIDQTGERTAVVTSILTDNGTIPYGRQPLYPLVLTPAFVAGGLAGMMVVSLLGTWTAALAGSAIARILDPRMGIPALWLIGLGSPLFFDAYLIAGHSLVAAAVGVAALGLLRAGGFGMKPQPMWLLVAIPATATAVLIRSEGVLATGLLGVIGAVCALRWAHRRVSIDWSEFLASVSLGATAVAAYTINGVWSTAITGGANTGGGDLIRQTDPLNVVWVSLIRPWTGDNRQASVAMALVVVATAVGAITLRFLPDRPLLPVALLLLAAAGAVVRLFEVPDLVSGLLACTPILILGWVLLPAPTAWSRAIWLLAGTSVSTAALIVWTTYGDGGATEWGGRFFHVILPLAVPVALVGVFRALSPMARGARILTAISIAVTAAALSTAAFLTLNRFHDAARAVVTGTNAFVAERADDDTPIVLYAPLSPSGSSRLFWDAAANSGVVLNADNIGGAAELLERIADSGRDQAFILTTVDVSMFEALTSRSPDFDGWKIASSRRLHGSSNTVIELDRR